MTIPGAGINATSAPRREESKTHWFLRGRRPYLVSFHRTEGTKGQSQRRIESLVFKTVGSNQRIAKEFVAEVVAAGMAQVHAG